jgi:hypothetical protein
MTSTSNFYGDILFTLNDGGIINDWKNKLSIFFEKFPDLKNHIQSTGLLDSLSNTTAAFSSQNSLATSFDDLKSLSTFSSKKRDLYQPLLNDMQIVVNSLQQASKDDEAIELADAFRLIIQTLSAFTNFLKVIGYLDLFARI